MKITIPMKLLEFAEGGIVVIELKNRDVYRGLCIKCDPLNWNCELKDVTLTPRVGNIRNLEYAFIRGSSIHFMILPDILKNHEMFRKAAPQKPVLGLPVPPGRGIGRGRGWFIAHLKRLIFINRCHWKRSHSEIIFL